MRITNHAVERRMVPVILFMFGGGPNTLTTVLNHIKNENPIIVFTGSGRVADLISDWNDYSREAELLLSHGQTSWIANEKRMTKARGWLLGQGRGKWRDAPRLGRGFFLGMSGWMPRPFTSSK